MVDRGLRKGVGLPITHFVSSCSLTIYAIVESPDNIWDCHIEIDAIRLLAVTRKTI